MTNSRSSKIANRQDISRPPELWSVLSLMDQFFSLVTEFVISLKEGRLKHPKSKCFWVFFTLDSLIKLIQTDNSFEHILGVLKYWQCSAPVVPPDNNIWGRNKGVQSPPIQYPLWQLLEAYKFNMKRDKSLEIKRREKEKKLTLIRHPLVLSC